MAQNITAVTVGPEPCTCLLPVDQNNIMELVYKYQDTTLNTLLK